MTAVRPEAEVQVPPAIGDTAEVPVVVGPTGPPAPPSDPPRPGRRAADVPRIIGKRTSDEILSFLGSGVASLCLTWVLYSLVLGLQGVLGFCIVWYVAFLAMYAGVTALSQPRTLVVDRLMEAVVSAGALVVFGALVTTLVYTVIKGIPALLNANFYTEDMAGVRPTDPLSAGGILHAVVGTLIQVGIAVVIALPLGIGTAVYMTEVGSTGARIVRTVVEAMTALPDILAGLFIYVTLILALGVPRSGFAAAMALTVMMTPIIARSAEVQLRVVPGGLREASLALGASQWRTVRGVVLPTAKAGLATAVILGIARAIGETAPVLITSGASTFLNVNPFQDPMNSLPLFSLFAVRSGQDLYIQRGFGAATVLLILVTFLFVLTRWLARDKQGR
ncbi:MAG: phosphate ABC transporter permease PstA [Frankiales bacterium]|nr:phosphate ABC transporter permease PstA [Frankiales bacterium]